MKSGVKPILKKTLRFSLRCMAQFVNRTEPYMVPLSSQFEVIPEFFFDGVPELAIYRLMGYAILLRLSLNALAYPYSRGRGTALRGEVAVMQGYRLLNAYHVGLVVTSESVECMRYDHCPRF